MKFLARRPWLVLMLILGTLLTVFPVFNTVAFYFGTVKFTGAVLDTPRRHLINPIAKGLFNLRQGMRPDRRVGLPQVRIYVSERARKTLMSHLPNSIKMWQPAHLLYPDGKLHKVKIRYRGDNNLKNFAFSKKAWRIKTRRKNLFNGRRVLNYLVDEDEDMISEEIVMWLARNAGITAAQTRMVELFVNDKSQGIVTEIEHLDEIFLRTKGIMPVNLYKGDFDSDWYKGLSWDLFYAPPHWSKIAKNNRYEDNNKEDLQHFFDLVRSAASSEQDFERLRRLAPFDVWARFAAFQVLVQSWHNDFLHNQRLIFDDQSGTVAPVPWDVDFFPNRSELVLNKDSHLLFTLYKRHSEFALAELRALYRLAVTERVLRGAQVHIDELAEPFRISLGRDMDRIDLLPIARVAKLLIDPDDTLRLHARSRDDLMTIENWITATLTIAPQAIWSTNGARFQLAIDGLIPLDDLTLQLVPGTPKPTKLVFDINRSGTMDAGDHDIPFTLEGDTVVLHAVWMANRRVGHHRNDSLAIPGSRGARKALIKIVATRFDILADRPLAISGVRGRNALTKIGLSLPRGSPRGTQPFRWNQPITTALSTAPRIWQGTVHIDRPSIIDWPVRIEAGTVVKMAAGASLIFRQKLLIEGTSDKPVTVTGVDDSPWGTLALQGPGTVGSRLAHLRIEGGSGAEINGINYLAMFSIHDTGDIEINGLAMRRNHLFDDMLHVVYGRGVHITGIDIVGARADAIDIDISDVTLSGGTIDNAGNDCIDMMTSTAALVGLRLSHCGDKGVSVGEASQLLIMNTVIENSNIGIESKDGSATQILNADFKNNVVQINAKKKNWRYGTGGRVDVRKSHLTSTKNILNADKDSSIVVRDSTMVAGARAGKRVTIDEDVDFSDVREARSTGYGDGLLVTPDPARAWTGFSDRRGAH